MKSIKIIAIIFILLVLFPATVSAATSYSPSDIEKREFVTGEYGKIACSVGVGDCVYLITNTDNSQYYKIDRAKFLTGSIVYSKSQPSTTINVGQQASISYTVKGSGADGFTAHDQKYEWYSPNGAYLDNQLVENLPMNKEYVWIHKLSGFDSPGTYEYTVLEFILIYIKNQNCLHLPCDPEYRQAWAKADEYYPKVIVNGGVTQTPTPIYTSPYPTYQPYPTYTPEPVPTVPTYTPPTTTPLKPKIIPKPIADLLGVKETPGFEISFAVIGIMAVLYIRRKL